jgi:hypothetical protein
MAEDGSRFSKWPLYPRFIAALFSGGKVSLRLAQDSGKLEHWSKQGLLTVIDEARRQLDAQSATLDRVLLRAQILLTTLLALAAIFATAASTVWTHRASACLELVTRVALCSSGVLLLLALLGAAAIVTVTKRYEAISAAVLSRWARFDLRRLAREYAESVGTGEQTGNAHITVFGTAVRLTVYGSILFATAWAISLTP